jgi:hypothetical protein
MSNIQKEFVHAPNAKLDYGFDWTLWLQTDEHVVTSSWVVSSELTPSLEQILNDVTSLYVEGGVVNSSYELTNSIITSDGRKDSRTMKLICKKR